jgi:hypothetical protein
MPESSGALGSLLSALSIRIARLLADAAVKLTPGPLVLEGFVADRLHALPSATLEHRQPRRCASSTCAATDVATT